MNADDVTTLSFERMPSLGSYLPRALIARRPPRLEEGVTVPRIEARIDRVVADPARVSRFSEVCAFSLQDSLPITYPHVIAAPLHMAMLTSKAFPVKLLGLVHVSNSIRQHVAIPIGAELGLHCFLEGHRDTKRGQEFELVTTARIDGAVAWEETTRFLARAPRAAGRAKPRQRSPQTADSRESAESAETNASAFDVPANTGRKYAVASGDYNPIHLSAATARLFGFRRAIAHGMWTLSRCAAELTRDGETGALGLNVDFKLPVLMPSHVALSARLRDSGFAFVLRNATDRRPHLSGTLSR